MNETEVTESLDTHFAVLADCRAVRYELHVNGTRRYHVVLDLMQGYDWGYSRAESVLLHAAIKGCMPSVMSYRIRKFLIQ